MSEENLFKQELLEKIKSIKFQYGDKIPEGVFNYYMDILNGVNIEAYMQTFSLSREAPP